MVGIVGDGTFSVDHQQAVVDVPRQRRIGRYGNRGKPGAQQQKDAQQRRQPPEYMQFYRQSVCSMKSTTLKTMVDDTFTPATGIRVNVKLVVADTLLTAVVAGNGPDVVLSLATWFPVNYAMRNAAEDLTQFEDFEEVTGPLLHNQVKPLL